VPSARRAARAWSEQGLGQGSRAGTVQDHPDRFLIRCPVPAGDGVPRSAQAGQVCLARLIHCPTAVNRSFPAAVNAQTATAIRQASW
jgi:hypothetical protein